jgi:hypothetical protein
MAGFSGPCGSVSDDAARSDTSGGGGDGGGGGGDASPADTLCSYTCWGPAVNNQSPVGTAPCQNPGNNCSTNWAWINPIDLCQCSAGEPELYIQRVGTTLNVALVAAANVAGSTYAMNINGGQCYGTGQVCPQTALAGCTQSSEVDGWNQIPMPTTTNTTFRFYVDDGASGCSLAPRYTFVVQL